MRRLLVVIALLAAVGLPAPTHAVDDPLRALDLPALMLAPAQIQGWLGIPDDGASFGSGRGFRESAADLAVLHATGAGTDPAPYLALFERTGFTGSFRQAVGYADFESRSWRSAVHFRFDAFADEVGAVEALDYLAEHHQFASATPLTDPAELAGTDGMSLQAITTSSQSGWSLTIARDSLLLHATLLHDGSGTPPDVDDLIQIGKRLLTHVDEARAGAAPHLSDLEVRIVSGGEYVGEPYFAYYQRLGYLDLFYIGLTAELRGFHVDSLGPASSSFVHNTGLKLDPDATAYDLTIYIAITEYATEILARDQFLYLRDRLGADRAIPDDRYGAPAIAWMQGDIANVLIRSGLRLIEVAVIPWEVAAPSPEVAAGVANAQLACVVAPTCERIFTLPADLMAD